jgi:3'-phosphoadenosine 5'-phosphosulfate (PAPS) 3'-phosphatase
MASTTPESSRFDAELGTAIDAARQTATLVKRFYDNRSAETYTKGDGSPVTDADLAADAKIREIIGGAFPNDAFLTEEGAKDTARLAHDRLWIVDPIDGTAEFIAGSGRFDILIALAVEGRPVVAVTIQPPTGLMHVAVAGEGSWVSTASGFEAFRIDAPSQPARLVCSKWYRAREGKEVVDRVAARIGSPAPPMLDVGFQPRAFDTTQRSYDAFLGLWQLPGQSAANEWDIAAPDLIVHEAGGMFTDLWGRRYPYNKRNTHISGGLLVSASPELHAALLEAVAPELPSSPPALDPADDLGKG